MKKLALVLALLLVAGVFSVFAADAAPAVKLSGAMYVWQNYESPDSLYAGRYRFRLNMAYADGGYGVKARLQYHNDGTVDSAWDVLPYAYGYVSILNGMVKVTAGKGVPFAYGAWSALTENILYCGPLAQGVWDNIVFGGKDSAVLTITPIKDLEIGVLAPFALKGATTPTATDVVNGMKFGVKYNLPDLLTVYGYLGLGSAVSYAATVSVNAVENLSASVKFESDGTDMGLGAALSYSLADLGLTISNDFAMTFGGSIIDDFGVTYAKDTWDVLVGFAYNDPMYIFCYFNAYVGNYTFDPYVVVTLGDTVGFSVTLMHTFAF